MRCGPLRRRAPPICAWRTLHARFQCHTDPRRLFLNLLMVFHRITALLVICVGLLFPGLSALACCSTTAPMHDCCPFGQSSPGQDPGASLVQLSAGTEICCTSSVTNAATVI